MLSHCAQAWASAMNMGVCTLPQEVTEAAMS
ncbi:MAG: hypothetical protein GAK34_03489 [Delftia tsuruhatensis]|nr:MAG: hypothetical protein GAK34_03489 [Delftia tsuruhatensis]